MEIRKFNENEKINDEGVSPQKKIIWDLVSTNKESLIYIGIALAIVVFNLIAVFGIDVLLHDDPAWYGSVVTGKPPYFLIKKMGLLYAHKEWLVWNIMAFSPILARGLYVLVLLVPLSCLFYYFLHHQFGFSRLSAATAAVLPNILPFQFQIPAGINMSYTLWGLLFSLLALIIGFHYLEKSTSKNWLRLAGAVISYYIACQLMEQSLFLFAPLAFAFFGYTKIKKKHFWLIGSFLLIAVYKLISMIINPRKTITFIPLETMWDRLGLFFKYSLPFPDIRPVFIVIILFSITFLGLISIQKLSTSPLKINKSFTHLTKKTYLLYFYGFFICWSLSSIVVFICLMKNFSPRYAHISSFGLNAIFIFSLFMILRNKFVRKFNIYIPLLIGIVLFSGVFRYFNLNKLYSKSNIINAIIVKELKKHRFPLNSQIVITGSNLAGIPKGWIKASGYFKYLLKRKDVQGIIRPQKKAGKFPFYNHFDPKDRKWKPKYPLTGLSLEQPVFLFQLDAKTQKLIQFQYVLHWQGDTKTDPWIILHLDKKSGATVPLMSGTGLKEYLLTLKKLSDNGISHSKIMWGSVKR